ncbi:MAG: hypothetical protein IKM61_00820 [Eubacteriaceae bacterium]|nr:hypothetical protein [Eubacteriaceae bacterium]
MLGLRTRENIKFIKYWQIVQSKAEELNCIYFIESGDGREYFGDEIEAEDVSGWLIPEEKADKFKQIWEEWSDEVYDDEWDEYYLFAEWETDEDNNLTINFNRY